METANELQLFKNGAIAPINSQTTSMEPAFAEVPDEVEICKRVLQNRKLGTAVIFATEEQIQKIVFLIKTMAMESGCDPIPNVPGIVERWATEIGASYPKLKVEEMELALSASMVHRSEVQHYGKFSIKFILDVLKFYMDWSFRAMQKVPRETPPVTSRDTEPLPEGQTLAEKHFKMWQENQENKFYRKVPEFIFNLEPVLAFHAKSGNLTTREIADVWADAIATLNTHGWIKEEIKFTESGLKRIFREVVQNLDMHAEAFQDTSNWTFLEHKENNFAKALANLKLVEYLYQNKMSKI